MLTMIDPHQRRALRRLVATEATLVRRRPTGLIVAAGVPLLLLVIFGSIPAMTKPQASLGHISFFNLYAPSLLVFVLLAIALVGVPQQLAGYRRQGVLRRMSTTPVSPAWLLGAQMAVAAMFVVIALALLIGVGAGAFGMRVPGDVAGIVALLVSLALAAGALLGIGLCAAALVSSPQVANAMTFVCFYPLAFFSGLYIPLSELHSSLVNTIAKVLPSGAAVNALHSALAGHMAAAEPLLVLAAWMVATTVFAARVFRWE